MPKVHVLMGSSPDGDDDGDDDDDDNHSGGPTGGGLGQPVRIALNQP